VRLHFELWGTQRVEVRLLNQLVEDLNNRTHALHLGLLCKQAVLLVEHHVDLGTLNLEEVTLPVLRTLLIHYW
jgi:hypothetical protein